MTALTNVVQISTINNNPLTLWRQITRPIPISIHYSSFKPVSHNTFLLLVGFCQRLCLSTLQNGHLSRLNSIDLMFQMSLNCFLDTFITISVALYPCDVPSSMSLTCFKARTLHKSLSLIRLHGQQAQRRSETFFKDSLGTSPAIVVASKECYPYLKEFYPYS